METSDKRGKRKSTTRVSKYISRMGTNRERRKGSHVLHQVIGHKADFMFMLLRPTMEELIEMENAIEKSAMGEFLFRTHSYFSVIELSKYRPQKDDVDPETLPETQARLKPILPK